MNTRAFTLSLLIAGIAVFMVMAYIDGEEAKLTKRYGNEITVVVAKENIQANELLDDKKVILKKIPNAFVAPKAITKKEDIQNTIATVNIIKGEQITKPRVTYPNVKTGLSRQVSPGKRAFAIKVSDKTASARLIKPGDRIDILSKIDYVGGEKTGVIVKTILQDVLVLSTGRNITNSIPIMGVKTPREIRLMNLDTYSNFSVISLEVTPDQAQKLTWIVENQGDVYVTLRNNDDRNISKIGDTTLFDVMGEDAGKVRAFLNRKTAGRKGAAGGR